MGGHRLILRTLLPLHFALLLGLRRPSNELDDSEAPPPSIVVAGIGDSGTTAVIRALNSLGLGHCDDRDQWEEPPWGHAGRVEMVCDLLQAGRMHMSHTAYQRNANTFLYATDFLQMALDDAYDNKTNYLIIARDPRDICTNDVQDQFMLYGRRCFLMTDCYLWWARFWDLLLNAYEAEPRFAVLRIEDLVVPDPTKSNRSLHTLRRVVEHSGMTPEWTSLQRELLSMQRSDETSSTSTLYRADADSMGAADEPQHNVSVANAETSLKDFHAHNESYMGHHVHQTEKIRRELRYNLSRMTSQPIIHRTMRRLGYDIKYFVLHPPESRAVL